MSLQRPCPCGSSLDRRELRDARNIFCCWICPDCEQRKRRAYRSEIFTNPNYAADEDIGDD